MQPSPSGTAAPGADIADLLIGLSRMVHDSYARVSDRHDLTPVQAKLLCALAGGPRGMAELADGFGVGKAALTGLVDRAEQRGLVKRSPVPHDRRALQVTLTEAGRRAAATFHADATENISRLASGLTPDDRRQLHDTLAKIVG